MSLFVEVSTCTVRREKALYCLRSKIPSCCASLWPFTSHLVRGRWLQFDVFYPWFVAPRKSCKNAHFPSFPQLLALQSLGSLGKKSAISIKPSSCAITTNTPSWAPASCTLTWVLYRLINIDKCDQSCWLSRHIKKAFGFVSSTSRLQILKHCTWTKGGWYFGQWIRSNRGR